MKDIQPETTPEAGDEREAWVEEGLRALREQAPSDASRRATLVQLGIDEDVPVAAPSAVAPTLRRTLLRWLLGGVLLGVFALVLRRWLG